MTIKRRSAKPPIAGYFDRTSGKFVQYSKQDLADFRRCGIRTRPAITKERILKEKTGFLSKVRGEFSAAEFRRMFVGFIRDARSKEELERLWKEINVLETERSLPESDVSALRRRISEEAKKRRSAFKFPFFNHPNYGGP